MTITPAARPRSFPWKRLILAIVLLALLIHFGPRIWHHDGAPASGPPPAAGAATPASTAAVIQRKVTVWSEFSGRLEAVNMAEIRPQVSGQITEVLFRDGSEVTRGQPLFTIDPRPYEAELARAKGALTTAKSAQLNASQQYGRAKTLVKAKAISQSEFEQGTSSLAQAQGTLETAEGALKAAELNLAYAHLTAPIAGKISRAEITQGNLVESGANAPLLASIVRLSPIYASFDLDEQTFLNTIQGVPTAKLRKIPVEVGVSSDQGTPIKATIHAFDNQITAGSGTIRVRALIENKNGTLVPGLFARVRIGSPEETAAILINPVAIGTDQNKKFVLVVGEGNKAVYREVTLGSMVDGLQVITAGLKEGEQIVVSGLQRLHPGAEVKPMPVDMLTLKPLSDGSPPDPHAPEAAAKPPAG